ncbi:MAG: phasin family protein [Rhodospirillales bacterium]|nr:phasin family protein [Rhodospirillales bacterium]
MTENSMPNFTDFAKLFDPANVARMFDPQQMMTAFAPAPRQGIDLQAAIGKSQKHFQAMIAANKAAAEAYRALFDKQIRIFEEITAEAKRQIGEMGQTAEPDGLKKQTELYAVSVEKALSLMTELSNAAAKANADAFAVIQGQVEDALKELRAG